MLEKLARLGYVAKALIYVTIGVLAAAAALGLGGRSDPDSRGAMAALIDQPFGKIMLAIVALGLVGYAVWRILSGVLDGEHRGHDAKGIAMRVGAVITGLIHGGLAYTAARLALGHGGARGSAAGGSASQTSQHYSARALELPGGTLILWVVAAGFVGYGLYQLYRAAASKLSKQLALGKLSREVGRWIIGVARFGIGSRGVVFGTIGVLFARAALHHDASQAGSVGKSLRELVDLGRGPFATIAIGLIAYGVYELINARYRAINVPDHVPGHAG